MARAPMSSSACGRRTIRDRGQAAEESSEVHVMRKLVSSTFLSLDGVMQAPGGPEEDASGGFSLGGWTVPYFDESVGAFMDDLMGHPFDLVLGRRTYDIFAAYWPPQYS